MNEVIASPLTLTFVGRPGPHPIACTYSGQLPVRVDSFDLVERAVLRVLCVEVIRAIDEHNAEVSA